MASIYFAAQGGAWMVACLLVLGAILLWQSYRHYPVRDGSRWLAMSMKFGVLLLLALCWMEPMWSGTSPKRGANDWVVLADNSLRYAAKNKKGQLVGAAVTQMLSPREGGGDPECLQEIGKTFALRTYQLGRTAKRVADFSGLDFTSTDGNMLEALKYFQDQSKGRAVAGILVFTDGNGVDLQALQDFENGQGAVPIYPVLIQGGEELQDLSLLSVEVSQSSFEDAAVTMTAQVAVQDLQGKQMKVKVLNAAGEVVVSELRTLGTKGEERVRLSLPSAKAGISFYTLEVALLDAAKGGEQVADASLDNNRRLVAVDRKRGPYRILYVSGRPNWDYKFMRRALLRDDDLDLVGLIRAARREPKFEWRGRTGELSNPLFRGFNSDVPEEAQRYDEAVLVRLNTRDQEELRLGFPKTEKELFGEYQAIILDDVETGFFTQQQMNLVERFVSIRGGALLMLGGMECFVEGGYDKAPIGDMLPVYLDRVGAEEADGPLMASRLSLTREGRLQPWARLRKQQDEEDARLAFMPEFHAANRVTSIKPGASLLQVLTDENDRSYPALVTQRYGAGRTAAYMLADVWRWGMKDEGLRLDMEKSWRQLMRWLVVDSPDLIEFDLVEKNSQQGGVVDFSAKVRDKAFVGNSEEVVKVEVWRGLGAGEKVAELFGETDLEQDGRFTADFYPREQGAYRAKLVVHDGNGKKVGQREVAWVKNSTADESARLAPNRAVLQGLAEATGGRVLEMSEVMDFVKKEMPKMQVPVIEQWSVPMWHTLWFFLAALLLLLAEWALRRWKGVI